MDVDFEVVPDLVWPANSIIVIDTASGKVIEDFVVDENGSPVEENGQPYSSQDHRLAGVVGAAKS